MNITTKLNYKKIVRYKTTQKTVENQPSNLENKSFVRSIDFDPISILDFELNVL